MDIMKNDAWLTPDGKIIEVGHCGHNAYAIDFLREQGDKWIEDRLNSLNKQYPYEILHNRGWVRVKYKDYGIQKIEFLGTCIDLTKQMKNTIDPAMNRIQLSVAKRLCKEVDTPFHVSINDKRFW